MSAKSPVMFPHHREQSIVSPYRSRAETHWLAMAQLNISSQLTMPTIMSAKKNAGVITAIVGIMSKGLHYYIASNRAMSGHSLH